MRDQTALTDYKGKADPPAEASRRIAPTEKSLRVASPEGCFWARNENPVVAAWVSGSLKRIGEAAESQGLPIVPHRLTPPVEDTFWVNLIGRGYPAPRNKFRWCTNRLKIQPSNNFIRDVVRENGEAILVLGTRRAESQARARNMAKHAANAVRERLSPNATLPNCLIYTPIERWANDDVWAFLTREGNPWGQDNHALMGMYRGASEDGECPLVIDKTTPSCGNSRFGCYVCTLVDQDRSMAAMIQNDAEKEWMEPLLALRDELDFRGDAKRATERKNRDFRRLSGSLTLYHPGDSDESQLVRGPYTQEARANWLRRVLETQQIVREIGPPEVAGTELLTRRSCRKSAACGSWRSTRSRISCPRSIRRCWARSTPARRSTRTSSSTPKPSRCCGRSANRAAATISTAKRPPAR